MTFTQSPTPGVWTLSGNIQESAGTYIVNFSFTDAAGGAGATAVAINVGVENAAVNITGPAVVKVAPAGGNSPAFAVTANINELADGGPGDIANAEAVTFTLTPVGAGATYTCTTPSFGISGQTLTAACNFANIGVNVYDVSVSVGGSFYAGSGRSVLVVYDPSLGFVTGSGRIVRTVNNETFTAEFAVNVKYQKDTRTKGSFSYVEHRASGDVVLNSDTLGDLAIIGNEALVTGTTALAGTGNCHFIARLSDMGEPATNDRLGIRVMNADGNLVTDLSFEPFLLSGGNIQVHH